ncbi:MAG: gliding motility-associated C-terminal domain-containing protein [Saprospiraceae bacterium]|nr:gliding motility-associated C-terminal domain-containing protein [Saprospiraceae bacterium]
MKYGLYLAIFLITMLQFQTGFGQGLTLSVSAVSPSCFGAANGSATVQASGGATPFTYKWNNGQTTQTALNLAAGTYTVTVTTATGLTASATTTLSQPALLVAKVKTTDLLCNTGPENGTAVASVQGGKSPYTYLWNTGATTKSIQNLGQDTYTVTVTDANGCTSSDFGLVAKPSPILVTITINSPSCNGSNGSATLNATGGTAPYTYVWKSLEGATGATQNNLAPGAYLVSVFDANGCEKELTVKIAGQGGLVVQLALSKAECTGINNGTAAAIITPFGSYNYSWNVQPNVNAPQITGLAANTQVTVTVTNPATGCTGSATGVIGVKNEVKIAVTDTDIACGQDKNGTATALASLGVAPYSYTWNYNNAFFANGPSINNLGAGTYPVTATDARGCIATSAANITAQSNPIVAFQLSTVECTSNQINVQFLDQSTDLLSPLVSWVWTVTPDGGTPFVLNGKNPPNMQFPEGQTGTVSLTITSEKGCTATLTKPYKIESAPTFDVLVQAPGFTCDGKPVNIKVIGNPIYTYTWTPVQGLNLTNAPFDVVADPDVTTQYILTVQSGQCLGKDTVLIKRSVPLNLQVATDSIVTCSPTVTLSATVNPAANATIQWFNGTTLVGNGANVNVSTAGGTIKYTVVATDENGCSASKKVSVTGLGISNVNIQLEAAGNICTQLPVTIKVTGPANYTYTWTPAATLNLANAPFSVIANPSVTTTYTLTVNNGICDSIFKVIIARSNTPIGLQVSTNNLITCDAISNIIASVTTTNAVTYQWFNSNGVVVDNDAILNIATAGTNTYTVVATDINGCTDSETVTIKGDAIENVSINLLNGGVNACAPGVDTLKVTGPANYTYTWTPDATLNLANAPFTVLANPIVTTTYTLTVNNGICDSIFTVTIGRSNAPIGLEVSTDSLITCDAISNIIASVMTTNAVTYQWLNSNGVVVDNDAVLNIATAGINTYTVVATDINGCTESKPVFIKGDAIENVSINLLNGGVNACAPGVDTLKVTGPANYTYTWTPDATLNLTNAPFTVLANPSVTTTYTLTVNNGICDSIFTVTIQRANTPPIGLEVSTDSLITCDAISNIIASVTTTNAVTYQWLNSNGVVVDNDAVLNIATAGINTYTVVATDINGCTESKPVFIKGDAIENVDINLLSGGSNACAPGVDTLKVTGPANYTYTWTPNATLNLTNAPFTVLANPSVTTTYTLTVNNGICDSIFTVTILRSNTPPIGLQVSTDSLVTCDSLSNIIATVTTTNAVTFQWLNSNGVVVDNDAVLNIATTGINTYTVVATDINGCTESKPVFIKGDAIENVSINVLNGGVNACAPGVDTLKVTGPANYTYTWTPDATLNLANAPFTVLANPSVTTTYTLTVNNGICDSIFTVTIQRSNTPTIGLQVSTDSLVTCDSLSNIIATVTTTNAVTFQWLNSNGVVVDKDAVLNIATAGINTYTVVATDINGCTESKPVFIKGDGVENINIQVLANTDPCALNPIPIKVTGSLTYTYNWTSNPTLDLSGAPFNVIANPTQTTTYFLQVNNGNCTRNFEIPVVVNFQPINLTVSTDSVVTCAPNTTISANASSNVTYQWLNSNGVEVDKDALLNIATAGSNTYTVVATDVNGCTESIPVDIIGNGVSNVSLDIISGGNPCDTLPVLIKVIGDPNNSYLWIPNPSLDQSQGGPFSVLANPKVTTTYFLQVSNLFCDSTFTLTIERNPPVSVQVSTKVENTCAAVSNITASSTGGANVTYQWIDAANGQVVDQDALLNVPSAGTHNYTVIVTDGVTGCTAAETVTVVGQGVDITLDTSLPDKECEGKQLQVCVNNLDPNDVLTYNWTGTFGINISPNNADCATVSGPAGVYTLTLVATNQFNCADTMQVPVEFEKSISLEGTISLDLCNMLKVGFVNTSGVAGTWTFGDNSTSTEQSPTHTYGTAGTYTVVFTPAQTSNCIAPFDTVIKVTNIPSPLANFTSTTASCINNAVVDFTDNSIFQFPVVAWSWSFPNGQPTTSNLQNPSAQFSQDGNPLVTLVVTDERGCTNTITKPLEIDIIPMLLEDSLKFCLGASVQLNPNLSTNFEYTWSANPGDPNLQVNNPNPSVSPSVPTIYSVNVKNGFCSTDFTVFVDPQPQATVDIVGNSKDTVLCNLTPITLTANSNNAATLSWSNNLSFNPVLGTGPAYTLQTLDPNYVLYVKAGLNGCDAIDSIVVRNQTVQLEVGAYDNFICNGAGTNLNLINLVPAQNLTYTWSPNLPGINNPFVNPTLNTTYTVTATNAAGCTATASMSVGVASISVDATVVGPDSIYLGQTATLLATSTSTGGVVSYQWIPTTGLSNPLAAETTASPTEDSTIYTVIAQVDGRCPDTAQVVVYLRNAFCIEPYIFVPNAFSPNGDQHNDLFIVRFTDITELEFRVWNRWGEIVYQTTDINAAGWDGSYKGKDATPDSYAWYVRIKCGDGNDFIRQGNVTLFK